MIVHAVVSALRSLCEAATDVGVFVGPNLLAVHEAELVLIGSLGDPDASGVRASSEWSSLGPGTWRDEEGEVDCSAWSWSGGSDLAPHFERASEIAAACAAAVHGDRSLGGLLVGGGRAEVGDLVAEQVPSPSGAVARVTFTVTYRTLVLPADLVVPPPPAGVLFPAVSVFPGSDVFPEAA